MTDKAPFPTKVLPTIPFSHLRDLTSRSLPPFVFRFIIFCVSRLSGFLAITLGIIVPERYSRVFRDAERVGTALEDAGVFKASSTVTSQYPDEPQITTRRVALAGKARFGIGGKSSTLFMHDETLWPAIGEALERWCIEYYLPSPRETWTGTLRTYHERGGPNLRTVAGFDRGTRTNHAALRPLPENAVLTYVRCTSLTEPKKRMYAPLQWFSFKHTALGRAHGREPVISPLVTTGAAAGETKDHALLGGMLEIIERDAFMIHWLRKITPKRIDLTSFSSKRMKKIQEQLDRYRLEAHALYLETDAPVHVVSMVIIDRTGIGPAMTIDTAAGYDIEEALIKTFTNAAWQRDFLRKEMEKGVHLPYAEHDMTNLTFENRWFWWCFLERLPLLEFFIAGPIVPIEDLSTYGDTRIPAGTRVVELVTYCRDNGYDAFYKDILPRELKRILGSLSVVFVRMPQFQPLYLNEIDRSTYGERLTRIPEKLGLSPQAAIHDVPHPFV